MLVSMSEIDAVKWSGQGVNGLLPTGTVTLLLADVEGSTRLWETLPEEMTAAVEQLDRTLADLVGAHRGVRPVEQGEGDSFVVAFDPCIDAVACALALQRAPLSPILLRIGVHTGEVQLRDEGNYIGLDYQQDRTAARSGTRRPDRPVGHDRATWLWTDLPFGRVAAPTWQPQLRDLRRPERVMQLCHPDLHNEFPPLRTSDVVLSQRLPPQLTSFVGREAQMADVRRLLGENRLVTLTGAGGIGKTRLAVQVATQIAAEFGDGVMVRRLGADHRPRTLVAVTAARALGLPDQPGRSTTDTAAAIHRQSAAC